MARHWKIAIALLGLLAIVGLLTFPDLLRSVLRIQHASDAEEQARREMVAAPVSTPTDTPTTAQLFWASSDSPGTLEATAIQLPLSADPAQRAKQLITALIEKAPTPAQRTLPADATLTEFYLLPDGTGVADFSETLGTETPSGILSEQMAVDSIVRTLAANVTGIRRLKILIHGQEAETLAGHLDLTGYFPVAQPQAAAPSSASTPLSLPSNPPNRVPAAAPSTAAQTAPPHPN